MSERLLNYDSSEIKPAPELGYSVETRKLWQEYQDTYADYQVIHSSIDSNWHSPEAKAASEIYSDLKRQSHQVLRSLKTPEQRLAFQAELTERYIERTEKIAYGHEKGLHQLETAARNRRNCDPMLTTALTHKYDALYDSDRNDTSFKIPLRALIATLSPEERVICGIDVEENRVAKIDQTSTELLNVVPLELLDVVQDCRESLLEANESYDALRSSYATLALYTAPREFDKREINQKLGFGAQYETVDLDLDYSDVEDDYVSVNYDIVDHLPDKDTDVWAANTYDIYNGVNRIMHEMHHIYPHLHKEAMEDYSKMVAALSFDSENAEKIYSESFGIFASDLGLTGKDGVPEPIRDVINQTLKHYDDLFIADLRMDWIYSHHDMGETYDYSEGENITCIVSGLNQNRIRHFIDEVEPLCEAKVDELLAAKSKA